MWFSFNLSVDIRPRKENGLIFAVLPAGDISDSLSLQLINGSVQFSFNNGVGPIIVKATPPAVCDGQWHSIRGSFVIVLYPCHVKASSVILFYGLCENTDHMFHVCFFSGKNERGGFADRGWPG